MTIYLQTTPSIRKKRTTKASQKLLAEENDRRRQAGLPPLSSLKYPKRDTSFRPRKIQKKDPPRRDETEGLRSVFTAGHPNETARRSIMEQVKAGKITGAEAEEIIRKSKCLAPPFSKGAYQYISSKDSAKDAGRKK